VIGGGGGGLSALHRAVAPGNRCRCRGLTTGLVSLPDFDPETMRPLEDVRIIAVEQYGAGPWGSLHLADLGAEVIKIEDPATGGDVGRQIPPYVGDGDSLFFQAFNRNKKSMALDLRNEGGRRVFEDLVRAADVVFSNLRGDVPSRLGLRYADLSDVNPRIVCCSLSAYGMTGPRTAEPGYDYVLQGLAGWMSLTGEPDGPPAKTGLSLVDYSGGYVAAISMLAGLHAARRTGVGTDCDTSLFDTAISLLTYVGTWSMSREWEPRRMRHSAHPSLFPFQAFPTRDSWIVVACAKEKFWLRLVNAMQLDAVAGDERFVSFTGRRQHADELEALLAERFRNDTTANWVSLLHEAGVPCGPVNDVRAAFEEPQTIARDLIVEVEHPTLEPVRTPATAVRVGTDPVERRPGPALAEHTAEILTELLGYDAEAVNQLVSDGAFGSFRPEVAD